MVSGGWVWEPQRDGERGWVRWWGKGEWWGVCEGHRWWVRSRRSLSDRQARTTSATTATMALTTDDATFCQQETPKRAHGDP